MNNIFGLTTRGLEAVSAGEMAEIPGVMVTETGYRRVAGMVKGSPAWLLNLRTVDDVYVEATTWQSVGHTRASLGDIERWSKQLDLTGAAQVCAMVRGIRPQPLFSVTASFVGKRNYNADEIKNAVSSGVCSSYGWTYAADDREADFNVRIFIEHDMAYIGLRLDKSPLHERDYKQVQRPGSLKPTVAAAMLRLAGVAPGMGFLDPCCGAGTILIEGAMLGAIAVGGDIDRDMVAAARGNVTSLTPPFKPFLEFKKGERYPIIDPFSYSISVAHWDARELPLENISVHRIVTNLPWGRQIKVDDELGLFYRHVCKEMERVLAPSGRVAVLTGTPNLLQFEHLRLDDTIEISLFGQTPTIALYSAIR